MSTMLMGLSRTSRKRSRQSVPASPTPQEVPTEPGSEQRDSIKKGIPSLAGLAELGIFLPLAKKKAIPADAGLPNQESSGGASKFSGNLNSHPRQPDGIEVVEKLTKREQLKQFNFTSTLNWMADENNTFEEGHQRKLKEFLECWEKNNAIWFHGLPSRRIVADLVMMTGPNVPPLPYICIKGLISNAEIASFHRALSRRSVRQKYEPLKICYDKRRIRKGSSEEIYQSHVEYGQCTLCGTLVQAGYTGSGSWVSTIGGMLIVDGKMYAITTAHFPDGLDSVSLEAAADDSVYTPLEKDNVDNIEPALIVDQWKDGQEDIPGEPWILNFQQHIEPVDPSFWSNIGKSFKRGSDWCLLEIVDEALWLPNAVADLSNRTRVDQAGEVPWAGLKNTASRRYLNKHDLELNRKPVHVVAGKSGVCPGILSQNVSYLRLGPGPFILVWKVQLKPGFELQSGDSGSWVVDMVNNSVVGHVVAFTEGLAYLIPLRELFRDISALINPERPIRLPDPFHTLANLARYFHSCTDDSSKGFARMYAMEALTDAVLDLDTPDGEGRLIRSIIKDSRDVETLAQLLCLTGANVRDALNSPSAYLSDQAGEIKEEIQRLLLRPEWADNATRPAHPELVPEPIIHGVFVIHVCKHGRRCSG